MPRIYLDSNIFSNLRKNTDPKYQQLNQYINQYKENLSFFFSHAHIRDKKNDTGDIKLLDFKFMETIVKDNYLSYHAIDKNTSFYLATPQMVFDDELPENEFDMLLNFWEPREEDDDLLNGLKATIRKLFSQIKAPSYTDLHTTLTADQQASVSKFLPSGSNLTFEDILIKYTDFSHKMLTDESTYRELRNIIDNQINNGKYVSKDGSLDFNEALKDSIIQKSFLDYLTDSFKKDEETPYYDYYIKAYTTLDMLGVSKDKLSKKNRFGNLFNDALHSYYARYCDYFITEDKSTREKSQALYNLFGIRTQIMNPDNFIDTISRIGTATEDHIIHFFEKLSINIRTGGRSDEHIVENGKLYTINIQNDLYLNGFNEMVEFVSEEGIYYFLTRRYTYVLSEMNYREMGMMVNRCIYLFGKDIEQKGEFNFQNEVEEINKDSWSGRLWNVCSLYLSLKYDSVFKKLGLWIGPIVKKSP